MRQKDASVTGTMVVSLPEERDIRKVGGKQQCFTGFSMCCVRSTSMPLACTFE